jgi:hypothetical protein
MESTPDDREHGYDNELEEQAYEQAEESGEPEPDEPGQTEE